MRKLFKGEKTSRCIEVNKKYEDPSLQLIDTTTRCAIISSKQKTLYFLHNFLFIAHKLCTI